MHMAITNQPALALAEAFAQRFPRSLAEYQRASGIFPAGITHDSRHAPPYPVYVDRAAGARKWTVDGPELLDYWMGHGSLLLGHNHPAVVAAVQAQLSRGTHYGASHELEMAWGDLVIQLVPSAERVRFTSSGTEATLLALRLARAFTGRSKVVKFQGHFHGWHDYLAYGVSPPFDAPNSAGIPAEVLSTVLLAPPNSLGAVRAHLDAHPDVAAVILEPGGGSNGVIPPDLDFLHGLRTLTAQRNVVLIFDEVITGFRYARGGAQERYGVTPDLTTLAKVLAGGLPGGSVAGRAAILDCLDFHAGDAHWNRHGRVSQQGTFNANPLSAAAGIACLTQVAAGEPNRLADARGTELREGLDGVLQRRGVPGWINGESSVFHIVLAEPGQRRPGAPDALFRLTRGPVADALRQAMLLEGVDLMHTGALVSAAHSADDIAFTIAAFDRALARLQAAHLLPDS
jgi:glutamate-1-semialdehyde 2,1-aminomutase